MERIITFEKGYNCIEYECAYDSERCRPNSSGSHGLHGMNIRFVLKGDDGAVQFVLYTPFLPTEKSYLEQKGNSWMPADLGYHAKKPQYDGQKITDQQCQYCDGEPCYYDGSSQNAEDAYKTFVRAGEEDLWRFLDEYYNCVFNGGEYPKAGEYPKPIRWGVPQANKITTAFEFDEK